MERRRGTVLEQGNDLLIRGDYAYLREFIPRLKAEKIWAWDDFREAWVAPRSKLTPRQIHSWRQAICPSPLSGGFNLVTTAEFHSEIKTLLDLGLKSFPFDAGYRIAGSAQWPLDLAGFQFDPVYKMWVIHHKNFDVVKFREVLSRIKGECANAKGWRVYLGKKTYIYSGVVFSVAGTVITVLGDTYPLREQLRSHGFTYVDKVWCLSIWRESPVKYASIVSMLEQYESSLRAGGKSIGPQSTEVVRSQAYPTRDQVRYATSLVQRIGLSNWKAATNGDFGDEPPTHWFELGRVQVSVIIERLKRHLSKSISRP